MNTVDIQGLLETVGNKFHASIIRGLCLEWLKTRGIKAMSPHNSHQHGIVECQSKTDLKVQNLSIR